MADSIRRSLIDKSARVGVVGEDGRPTLTLRGSVQDAVMRHVLLADPELSSANIFDLQYVGDRDIAVTELYVRLVVFSPSALAADEFLVALGKANFYILVVSFTIERGVFRGLLDSRDHGWSHDVDSAAYETRRRACLLSRMYSMLKTDPTTLELLHDYYRLGGVRAQGDENDGTSHSINYLETSPNLAMAVSTLSSGHCRHSRGTWKSCM